MRRTIVLLFSTLFLVCNVAISGNEFWEKKDYSQWTQRECNKMLENSPWAKTYSIRSFDSCEYRVQFRSALPIRMAIVRSMQIASNYDKLSSEHRQEFDKRADEYLSTNFPDRIVVHLIGGTNSDNIDAPVRLNMDLRRYWQNKTTELLKNTVFLVPAKGNRIPLLKYNVSQGDKCELQFIFPRQHQGLPALGPEDKSFKLEFDYPIFGTEGNSLKQDSDYPRRSYIGNQRVFIEFKADKMLFNGKLEY